MTVARLRELLAGLPLDARVFEEREGEHRELREEDVSATGRVFDSDSGQVLRAGAGGFVVLSAWA